MSKMESEKEREKNEAMSDFSTANLVVDSGCV